MKNQLKPLIGGKVTRVTQTEIYFDNGYVVSVHPYETYVEKVSKKEGE